MELVDAPAYTSLPSIELVVIQIRISKEATGIVWAAGGENGAGAKAEDAEVYGAKGGRGDIKRRGRRKASIYGAGAEASEAAERKATNKTEIYKYIYVENRSSGPPSGRGSSARRGTCTSVV